ncbi:MAG: GntR family transcriptional regulator [Angustibacter sp.]
MNVPRGPRSLVDALTERLRQRILTSEIPAGAHLTENGVASSVGVARPTARAAIERLAASGLLQRRAHRSAQVPVFLADDVHDIYDTRILIEQQVVRRLAEQRLVPQRAIEAVAALRGRGWDASLAEILDADMNFHRALTDAVGFVRLSRMYATTLSEAQLCLATRQLHRVIEPRVVANEHAEILSRIDAGDPHGAAEVLTQHLDRARTALVRMIVKVERPAR